MRRNETPSEISDGHAEKISGGIATMGLTSALNTSLNGLALNETNIDVLGNNIANAGTNGFKASNVLFATQLSRTLSVGSRPTVDNGGTNPQQIGLGATTTSIVTDFSQGSISNSTSPSDLAIQGEGFFILDGPVGNVYSRAGNYSLNSADLLVNPAGFRVQGYGVDDDFNLVTTQLDDISIPLGSLNVAQQTANVAMSGALFSVGDVATQGSILTSAANFTSVSGSNFATDPVTLTTALSSVFVEGSTTPLFTAGETLNFAPRVGGRVMQTQTLDVTGATLGDFLNRLDDVLGLQSGGGIPQEGGVDPGVRLTAAGGIEVRGNQGTVNDVSISIGDITSTGTTTTSVPLTFNKTQSADGESSITDFVVFDSLGQEVDVKLKTVLESRDSASTTFRYFLESDADSDADVALASGTIVFDGNGQPIQGTEQQFSIDRLNTAAVSPMQLNINFDNVSGISTATAGSALTIQSQDGSDPGTLANFVIDETGVINGIFDNGIIRTLGQVVLGRFSNPQGLLENGDTTYAEGVASGSPFLVAPGTFGAGTIRSGAVELSNTDIGRNLVDLIVASTNYRGNARVIDSVQQLVDELLLLGR